MAIHDSIPKLGARNTRQRTAVVEVLRSLDKFASAKDIHQALIDGNQKVGLTTVYRTLQSLSEIDCLLYTSPSPRDRQKSRMPSSA